MKFHRKTFAASTAVKKIKNGTLDLAPEYQRGSVWTRNRKALLIDSVLRGYDLPKLYLRESPGQADAYEVVDEFNEALDKDALLKAAFEALTPGRQRGYLLHFSNAKQAATRISRIEQVRSRIMKGKGLTDCICGLSKRMPNCDGSHKFA